MSIAASRTTPEIEVTCSTVPGNEPAQVSSGSYCTFSIACTASSVSGFPS